MPFFLTSEVKLVLVGDPVFSLDHSHTRSNPVIIPFLSSLALSLVSCPF